MDEELLHTLKRIASAVALFAIIVSILSLGVMVFPLVIVGVLVLLAYGAGKTSRWM